MYVDSSLYIIIRFYKIFKEIILKIDSKKWCRELVSSMFIQIYEGMQIISGSSVFHMYVRIPNSFRIFQIILESSSYIM